MGSFRGQTQREREEWEQFLLDDEAEQTLIAERLEAPLKLQKLKKELAINAGKLITERKRQIQGYYENAFVPDDLFKLTFNNEQEVERFNRAEALAFYEEGRKLGWHGTPENIETLLSYFVNRPEVPRCFDIPVVDRRMYKAAFLSLNKDGLFDVPEPAPKPVSAPVPEPQESFDHLPRLPLWHHEPAGWKRQPDGSQEGWDLLTGERRRYSSYEINLLSAEDFRRAFSVKATRLGRLSFDR